MNNRKKRSKNSIRSKEPKNKIPLYRLENMEFYLTTGDMDEKSIQRFADEMLVYYLTHESSTSIREYHVGKGATKHLYNGWVRKFPYLKVRHEICMEILGLRREKIMEKNDPSTLKHKQHLYDEDWDISNKYHAALRNKEDKGASVEDLVKAIQDMGITDKMPNTNEVEEKE